MFTQDGRVGARMGVRASHLSARGWEAGVVHDVGPLPGALWIGGGSGAGKSTVAARLAERHGLRRYDTDAAMADHARRCPPQRCPRLAAFLAMSPDERWIDRSPREMLETFHWYVGEGFDLVVEDVAAMGTGPVVVVEGFRLLPHLVAPLLGQGSAGSPGAWLLPTPRFREAAFARRGTTGSITGTTSDPPRALVNLLERDALFTEVLRAEVGRLGLAAVEVDVGDGEDEVLARVEAVLGL